MYVLVDTVEFWWPVTAFVPDEKVPGKHAPSPFELRFQSIDLDDQQALTDEIAALPEKEQAARQHDLLRRVIIDWRKVVDTDKQPVPFSAAMLHAAIQKSWFRLAAYTAWADAMSGRPSKASAGN